MLFIKISFLPFLLFSATSFQTLVTKQKIENIKLIIDGGKHTYYSNSSGELHATTHYDQKKVLEGEKDSEYQLKTSMAEDKILIFQNKNYLTELSHNKLYTLYFSFLGSSEVSLITDQASDAFFAESEKEIIVYSKKTHEVSFHALSDPKTPVNKFVFKHDHNFSFSPKFYLTKTGDLYFTGITKNNKPFLALTDRNNTKEKILYTGQPGSRLEYFQDSTSLYLCENNIEDPAFKSKILKAENNKFITLYKSNLSDLGQCLSFENQIFFIKSIAYNEDLHRYKWAIAKLDLSNNQTTVYPTSNHVTSLIRMGDMVLFRDDRQFKILASKQKIKSDDIKK